MATNNLINKNNDIAAGQVELYNTQLTATGDGTIYHIPFDTATYDNNYSWDIANKRFVAPVAGTYYFNTNVYLQSGASGTTYAFLTLTTTLKEYMLGNNSLINDIGPLNAVSLSGSVLTYMGVGDTAYIAVTARNGTKNVAVVGYTFAQSYTWFSWFLVQTGGSHV